MSNYVDVSDMDEEYRKAESAGFVPDNTYQVEIIAARFKFLPNGNDRIFEWIFRDTATGMTIKKSNLLRKDLLHWLKTDLKTCGWDTPTLTEIQQKCAVVLPGLMLEIKVENKDVNGKPRQYVYIQKCLNAPSPRQEDPPPPEKDLPF